MPNIRARKASTAQTTADAPHPKAPLMSTPTAIHPVPTHASSASIVASACPSCGAGVVARVNVLAQLIYFDCTNCAHYTTVPIRS